MLSPVMRHIFNHLESSQCGSYQQYGTADIEAKLKIIPSTLKPVPGTAQFHEIKTVKHNGIVQLYASKLSGEEGKKINLTLK